MEPKLHERDTGALVGIKSFLANVKLGQKCVVAWDEGGHELGGLRMCIGVVRTEDIKNVLRHRWASLNFQVSPTATPLEETPRHGYRKSKNRGTQVDTASLSHC